MIAGVLVSEWVKIRSVRSTYYILGALLAAIVLASFLRWRALRGWDALSVEQRLGVHLPEMQQIVLPFLQLCSAALGVLAIADEYASGTIRSSLASVPHRVVLLTAKAVVVAVLALLVGTIVPSALHVLDHALIHDHLSLTNEVISLTRHVVPPIAFGAATMTIALVGLGLGAALRSVAGALVAVAALLFMLPVVANYLPEPWNVLLTSVALTSLGSQVAGHAATGAVLTPQGAVFAMMAYVAAAVGAGAAVLVRSDH